MSVNKVFVAGMAVGGALTALGIIAWVNRAEHLHSTCYSDFAAQAQAKGVSPQGVKGVDVSVYSGTCTAEIAYANGTTTEFSWPERGVPAPKPSDMKPL